MSLAAQVDFKNLKEVCPSLIIEASYSTTDNFTGSVIPGYFATKAMAHNLLAEKICSVQAEALKMNLSLKIFDAYRPQKAVNYFIQWGKSAEERLDLKNKYYLKTKKNILQKIFFNLILCNFLFITRYFQYL